MVTTQLLKWLHSNEKEHVLVTGPYPNYASPKGRQAAACVQNPEIKNYLHFQDTRLRLEKANTQGTSWKFDLNVIIKEHTPHNITETQNLTPRWLQGRGNPRCAFHIMLSCSQGRPWGKRGSAPWDTLRCEDTDHTPAERTAGTAGKGRKQGKFWPPQSRRS